MAQHGSALLRVLGHHFEATTRREGPIEIEPLAVDLDGDGGLGEALTDALGNCQPGCAVVKVVKRAVWEGELNGHDVLSGVADARTMVDGASRG